MEIFEAIIAMPLWALAHLRIDGDGMPGPAAIQGYTLIFMILLRPILIVFGLIAGYLVFGAAVFFLTSLFDMAISATRGDLGMNSTWFGLMGGVGALGMIVYTLIYVFLAYNIAVSCFKMIDDVPKQILRWLGSGVQSFGDSRQDPIQGQQAVLAGAVVAGGQLKGGFSSATQKLRAGKREKEALKDAADKSDIDTKRHNETTGILRNIRDK